MGKNDEDWPIRFALDLGATSAHDVAKRVELESTVDHGRCEEYESALPYRQRRPAWKLISTVVNSTPTHAH